jgi:hypothetical protein
VGYNYQALKAAQQFSRKLISHKGTKAQRKKLCFFYSLCLRALVANAQHPVDSFSQRSSVKFNMVLLLCPKKKNLPCVGYNPVYPLLYQ